MTADAEPVLVEAAGRLDPPRLRRVLGHLRLVADPDNEASRTHQRYARRGLWLAPTFEGMVALDGLLDPEAGQTLLAALEPLARPTDASDARSGRQRTADALTHPAGDQDHPGDGPNPHAGPVAHHPSQPQGLGERLAAALALLPPSLGGAPTQPLDVGRTSRVVHPAQRTALAVRDGGCVFPDCQRPLAWCEAHHLWHWLAGGPTDLANLALVCRAHHRAVHEGGWRLTRDPEGHLTATPPHRRHRAAA